MKSLIVYSSKSGNTKKLAEAVYNHLTGEKELCAVGDAPDPAGYDFVAMGFWLQGGQPDPASQEFLAKIEEGQRLYLFATHGAATGSPHAVNAMNSAKAIAAKGHIIATFSCLGQVPEKVLEMASRKDPQPPWFADAPAAVGHPDEKDMENVVRLLEELDLP
ncbi:MAG: flavodoxin family protein [Desulfocapsa sp.]|nr:flavodoxin family protein [Desulfocapsa sp.]